MAKQAWDELWLEHGDGGFNIERLLGILDYELDKGLWTWGVISTF